MPPLSTFIQVLAFLSFLVAVGWLRYISVTRGIAQAAAHAKPRPRHYAIRRRASFGRAI